MSGREKEQVDAFLNDFTDSLASEFSNRIDFILLFGSAARGEFKKGVSDLDIIIQVKDKKDVIKVEKFSESIFWKLDKKYDLKLKDACSSKKDMLSRIQRGFKLYKPFEVIGPDDINWKEGKITDPSLVAWGVIAPVQQFAKKLKSEGKILYGRNILDDMRIRESLFDKAKALIIPTLISLASVPISIFLPDRGIKLSAKAIFYSVDDQLFVMGKDPKKKSTLNLKILKNELGELYSVRLAKEAFEIKRNFPEVKKNWTYIDKVAFCFQSVVYIQHNNLLSFFSYLGNLF